jgi:tRNA (guanine37-N1)-methyltransferase
MRLDIVTLFPEMFEGLLGLGIVGRAVRDARVTVRFASLRDHGMGKHRRVDDTPYGGGAGMVMCPQPLIDALESLDATAPHGSDGVPLVGHRVLLSPQGRPFDQSRARELSERPAVTLVCGRYEGVDERVRSFVDEELSLGDFVMSGGEIGAMAVIDACVRLLPGVVGNPESLSEESHSAASGGLLEYPQYTRPEVYRDLQVPPVLLSGDHARIAAWRKAQSVARTQRRRPDLAAVSNPKSNPEWNPEWNPKSNPESNPESNPKSNPEETDS